GFADAVDRDDSGLLKRRGIERRGGMRLVVLAEEHFAFVALEMVADVIGHPELVGEPQRQGHQVRLQPARCTRDVRLEQALELDQRLLVETDQVQSSGRNAGLAEAVTHGNLGKPSVVLLSGEPLLLSGRDDATVFDKTGGRVVIVRRETENARHFEAFKPQKYMPAAIRSAPGRRPTKRSRYFTGVVNHALATAT